MPHGQNTSSSLPFKICFFFNFLLFSPAFRSLMLEEAKGERGRFERVSFIIFPPQTLSLIWENKTQPNARRWVSLFLADYSECLGYLHDSGNRLAGENLIIQFCLDFLGLFFGPSCSPFLKNDGLEPDGPLHPATGQAFAYPETQRALPNWEGLKSKFSS